ncbi:Lipase_GDSL domain-containing protein [Cephalotus follicularis]|uniref:Lipase_GDSL domain-containing protein n=1 Tax=Cephalotus follicularis TaxID=3775 RepID=A0A1Q3BDR3_CEPFO|nr:Lipase_GDSL domain-containing protein [Cephalotus follicularis]
MDTSHKPFFYFLCFFVLSLFLGNRVVHGSTHHHHHHHVVGFRPTKLFVFGDSYADTGNTMKSFSSWKVPYGITFPGKPVGRFSDGRVWTDFLARFIGVKSPIPYRWRKVVEEKRLRNGMNFAYGGTGVFETLYPGPNMTTQIDFFQQLIKDSVYTTTDLNDSMALVSLSGNDYSTYTARNGSAQGWTSFITQVVNQLALNLKRIHGLGVKKLAVAALQPLGCLPSSTVLSSYQKCNETQNQLVSLHNLLLQQAVAKFNNETKDSTFVILDLYDAFINVINNKGGKPGSSKFENPLKPCCVGESSKYSCGSLDESGAKKYTVCDDRESAFFWDTVHPTQAGWRAVYVALHATLQQTLV